MTKKSLSLKRFILGGPRSPARSETSFSGLRAHALYSPCRNRCLTLWSEDCLTLCWNFWKVLNFTQNPLRKYKQLFNRPNNFPNVALSGLWLKVRLFNSKRPLSSILGLRWTLFSSSSIILTFLQSSKRSISTWKELKKRVEIFKTRNSNRRVICSKIQLHMPRWERNALRTIWERFRLWWLN